MPEAPKGQKRPANVIGNAVKVMRIATGEEKEEFETLDGKDAAAVSMDKRGGQARASKLTPEQRKEIAKKAAAKRWGTKFHSDLNLSVKILSSALGLRHEEMQFPANEIGPVLTLK